MQTPELAVGEVCQRVMLGMMAQQPLEVDFFPGILEGLVGRLGLAPSRAANPPTSVREGVMRRWVAALREAVQHTEGGAIDPGQAASDVVPHALHLNYDVDFRSRRVGDITPTLMSPLLPNLISFQYPSTGVSTMTSRVSRLPTGVSTNPRGASILPTRRGPGEL